MKLPRVFMGTRRWSFLRIAVSGVLEVGGVVATALLIQQIFDRLILKGEPGVDDASVRLLLIFSAGLVLVGLLIALLKWQQRYETERLGQHYVYDVRQLMFEHLANVSPRALQRRGKGGVLLRFVGDLTALRQWISLGLVRLSLSGIVLFGSLIALAVIDWAMATLILIAILLGGLCSLFLGGALERAIRDARRRRAYLASNLTEKITHPAVMQVNGQVGRERKRIRKQSRKLQQAMLRRAYWTGSLRAVSELTARLATTLALIVGALQVFRGVTTPGTVVGAMSVVGMLSPNIKQLGRVHEYWRNATVAGQKLNQFLSLERVTRSQVGKSKAGRVQGRLSFEQVSVKNVFSNISVTAEPGEKIAVQGANGSGKTTLLWLVAGLMTPHSGSIRLDGKRLQGENGRTLHSAIAMVSLDLPLYRGSLRKNMTYRYPSATEQELRAVIEQCELQELIDKLPGGLDEKIVERGMNLSTGERQKVALARALLGHPRVLLLDEAESNFDVEAQRVYRNVLERFSGTLLMTTHNLIPFEGLSKVWLLEGGALHQREPMPFNTLLKHQARGGS